MSTEAGRDQQLDALIRRQKELDKAMQQAYDSFGTPAFAALRKESDENHLVLVDLALSMGIRRNAPAPFRMNAA